MTRERTLVTHVVDTRYHSDLGPLDDKHLYDATRAAAAERETCLDRHAVLVLAAWLDARVKTHLRCWLRAAPAKGGPVAVAVGDHDHVDVGPIHGAALRHALIVLDPELRGDMLDVIDLASHCGLRVDGHTGALRLQGQGAVRFGAGSADILAISLAPGVDVDDALERMNTAELLAARTSHLDRNPLLARAEKSQWGSLARNCELSVVGVADLPRRETSPMQRPAFPHRARIEGVTFVSKMRVDDHKIRVTPTEQELRNGFLIGRYERCAVRGEDENMSRVHAFVLGRRVNGKDTLLIADAGSTQGTTVLDGQHELELDRGHRATVTGPRARLLCGQTVVEIVPAS